MEKIFKNHQIMLFTEKMCCLQLKIVVTILLLTLTENPIGLLLKKRQI